MERVDGGELRIRNDLRWAVGIPTGTGVPTFYSECVVFLRKDYTQVGLMGTASHHTKTFSSSTRSTRKTVAVMPYSRYQ
jgi:hypothetical protein